jgi:hypothetical protein
MIAFPDGEKRSYYVEVLKGLYNIDFGWILDRDQNRAKDGEQLRVIFEDETDCPCEKYGPCSVLEMMLALAMRCESQIMYDPDEGDRVHIWFWEMFHNLGLDELGEDDFDELIFSSIIQRLLGREYSKDGRGGLFYIPNCHRDMRKIEIWYQLNFYLQEYFL